MLPDLENQIVSSHMLTPQDFQDRLSSFRGAAFGLEPDPDAERMVSPAQQERRYRKPVSGRRRHPSRCGPARRAFFSPRSRFPRPRRAKSAALRPGDCMTNSLDSADMAACRALLKGGSRTFHAASKVLPRRVSDPAIALYAFCRLADDAVDLGDNRAAAVERLKERLDRAYRGQPMDQAADRAFADVVARFSIPREVPEALLEGLAWDAEGRRYETLPELYAYAARVAGTVGAMMTLVMGQRTPEIVARACDLGVAMQLTNIARDVGEDARAGRLYLPLAVVAGRRHRSGCLAGQAGVHRAKLRPSFSDCSIPPMPFMAALRLASGTCRGPAGPASMQRGRSMRRLAGSSSAVGSIRFRGAPWFRPIASSRCWRGRFSRLGPNGHRQGGLRRWPNSMRLAS